MSRVGTSRHAVPLAILAALLAGPPAGAAAGAGGSPAGGDGGQDAAYGARLRACLRSPRIDGRTAVLGAWMRPIAGAGRLALKVDLLQRPLAGGRWTLRADVPGLGVWTAPADPALGSHPSDLFKYRQAVGRLVVAFAYRFRVRFRWRDAQGEVVREASATTAGCRQPDLRPDLLIAGVHVRRVARAPGVLRYGVLVRNDGRSAARGVTVAATLPGDAAPGTRVRGAGRLEPGEAVEVAFTGPGCPAGAPPPAFAVDPRDAVDEADETNDAFALACPQP